MNILIPYSWLKEYLETKASPEKIGQCLSLCGPSVEKIISSPIGPVFDIEVTTNRVDMMSVAGIAREAATILPRFGIKAKFINDPYKITTSHLPADATALQAGQPPAASKKNLETGNWKLETKLKVHIKDKSLCSRFAAVVIENVKIHPSPKKTQNRLEAAGIRSLNNVIDISNYLMRAFGQPVHVFDYDKIGKKSLIMRESRKGEKVTTLDGREHLLPGGDIVIEDGNGELIDLCGIMGGKESSVNKNTKRVLLFVQTYNPVKIRQTSMKLAQRTEAAQLFEKGIDTELVMLTMLYGIKLFKEITEGKPASKIYYIYPQKYQPQIVKVSLQFIEERLGTSIQSNEVKKILGNLGFSFQLSISNSQLSIIVPSWRAKDILIPEDIVEEVARIYGYHNLPSVLPSGRLPKPFDEKTFYWERKVKNAFKNWGLTETYTYSLQSKRSLRNFELEGSKHLKLKNPLTKDWIYLRTSILPSLLNIYSQNKPKEKVLLFELAKVYLKRKGDLPNEVRRLTILGNYDFYKIKGIVEALGDELGIKLKFTPYEKIKQLHPTRTAIIETGNEIVGTIGQIENPILERFSIKEPLVTADLNFDKLAIFANNNKTYQKIPKYPPIIEHLTFINEKQVLATNISKTIKKTQKLIKIVKILDVFKTHITLEIHYQSRKRSLNDKEVEKIRKEIVKNLQKLGLALHGKI